jgi:isoleucyl-tRNA synthetase
MRRIEDVLDVWFDSGSMPYAQVHYPFDNTQWFEDHYPGDFIVEYIGQTRGWFYTMHVLATALFDRPAFASCISHGIVLGSDGQKMSKSLRNYPDVFDVFDRDGADAMRWFLMSSPILRGGNLIVTEQGIRDGVRQVMIPLWNAYYFFSLYANAAQQGQGYDASWRTDSTDVLDRYILAKTAEFVQTLTTSLDDLSVAAACDSTRSFLEVLSNWYIRRSRDRFWDGESEGARQAFDTLYTVLEVTTRAVAPLLPLVTEEIYRGLTGVRSVHLTDWPEASALPVDDSLVAAMDRVREVCSSASALRKAEQLRVRLPLSRLTVVSDDAVALQPFLDLVRQELNVREVELVELSAAGEGSYGVTQTLQVNARAAGPRLGRTVQQVIKASKSGDWSVGEDGTLTAGGIALLDGEYTMQTVVDGAATGPSTGSGSGGGSGPSTGSGTGAGSGSGRAVAMLPGAGFVILDTTVTPELAAEGLARDVVRVVQQGRREAGLDVSDRIRLTLGAADDVTAALRAHAELISSETLASELVLGAPLPDTVPVGVGDGQLVTLSLSKVLERGASTP